MPRWPLGAASSLLLVLLVGAVPESSAAPQAEDLRRLKQLQQWQLMNEPAEKAEKKKEQLERLKQWRKAQKRGNAGSRIKVPPKVMEDIGRGKRPDFFAGAKPAARSSISAFANYLVNDTTGEAEGSCQSEVSIAARGNDVVAAWNDGIGVHTGNPHFQGWGWSTDGGVTWTDGGPPPTTGGIGQWSSDPVVTVNAKTGEFYFSALADQATTSGVAVVRGTFSGSGPSRTFTWGTPVMAVTLSGSSFCPDKEWVVADSVTGNVYVTYTRFIGPCFNPSSDEIVFVRSTNSGQNWDTPIVLSTPSDAGYVQGSRPAVGPNGEVYVVWHAIGQFGNSPEGHDFLRIRKSTNAGASFGPEVTAASIFSNFGSGGPGFNRGRGITFPGIAVDNSTGPHRGRVYLTWSEAVDFYADNFPIPGSSPAVNEVEPNDDESQATHFSPGSILRGVVLTNDDLNYWKWNAVQGQTYTFLLDSLYSTLLPSFRVFSTNGGSNLAFSQNGYGNACFIVFTAPTTDTYYLRLASYTQQDPNSTGRYKISTVAHAPHLLDLARDHRDLFVSYSDNGTTWVPGVRVNDSPAWFDEYLPEVAVDVGGRVFAAVYDWRDASPLENGGASSAYLYRSDTGGASWNAGTRIQNEATNWWVLYSTLIPNQGDYIGLATSDSTVFVGWADGRGAGPDPDVYVGVTKLNCVSAPIFVSSATAGPDSIRIVWSAPTGTPAQLFRRQGSGPWLDMGPVVASANQIVHDDSTVVPGETFGYRLGVTGFCQDFVGEIALSVPNPPGPVLSISGVRPNPTPDQMVVSFVLPDARPAKLSLHDISGRLIHSVDVSALGPGQHSVNLSQGLTLRSGMYFVLLTQGGKKSGKRVVLFP